MGYGATEAGVDFNAASAAAATTAPRGDRASAWCLVTAQ